MIKIALDVMAGDKGIDANIDGALSSLDGSFMVSLVGDQNLIRDKMNQSKNKFLQSINIVNALYSS